MFVLCLSEDLWYFSTSLIWSLILFLRAPNFLVSEFMTLTPESMFSSKRSSSHSFYCRFSAQVHCVSCVGAFFFYCPERVLPCRVTSWRETWSLLMMGVLLFCHMFAMTWDPSRVDIQWKSWLRAAAWRNEKQDNLNQEKSATLCHTA